MISNKIILGTLLVFAALLVFSSTARATIDTFGGTVGVTTAFNNNTIIGGTDTATTIVIAVSRPVSGAKNWSMLGVFTNASGGTWTRASLTAVSANTTCYGTDRGCNHTGSGNRGAMGFSFALPSDVVGSFLRIQYNSSGLGTKANFTRKITFDSTAPTFTLYPASSFVQTRSNRTINITIVTNENASSVWAVINGVNYSSLSNSNDLTWKQSVALSNDGIISFYARAYDYAADGSNGGTSSIREFQLNTGRTRRIAPTGVAAVSTDKSQLLKVIGYALLIYIVYNLTKKK